MPPRDATSERGRLFGLAYRMLGDANEAEDAVQEAFTRLAAETTPPDVPAAWLTTVTTRICIDRLRVVRRARELYPGPWLPTPLVTDDLDPAALVDRGATLTLAFLVVLESLTPLERAVFLLHDVFGHPFADVAVMVDRRPEAVRKAASRARSHIAARRPGAAAPDPAEAEAVTAAFLAACAGGDLDEVLTLVAPDVEFVSDGGGRASALPRPVRGADAVAGVLLAFARAGIRRGAVVTTAWCNLAPTILVHEGDRLVSAMVLTVRDGVVHRIDAVRNPDKLGALRA